MSFNLAVGLRSCTVQVEIQKKCHTDAELLHLHILAAKTCELRRKPIVFQEMQEANEYKKQNP